MLNYIFLTLFFCITPAGVIWLCRKVPLLDKLGPIMVLYVIGMIVGNLPFLPDQVALLQDILPNVMIPLAIPMMLFGCTFSRNELSKQVKIAVSGFFSVCCAVVLGYLFFGHHLNQSQQIGGIITGMYTGGTLNAAALQSIFKINSETFILINSYDIIISFLYFVFLFSFGIRLFRRAFGQGKNAVTQQYESVGDDATKGSSPNPYRRILSREGAKELGRIVLLTLLIVALSALSTLLFEKDKFMVVFILMLTTLGVVSSFFKRVQSLTLSYDVGMYLIYIFSLVIASMADFSRLDLVGGVYLIAFMTIAVFLSLFLHAVVCRLMRLDADSMVISSVAFINSPPFVPMAAAAMQNREALVTGLGAGILGYALGNHLGVFISEILLLL